jgi:DNA-binding transcriptional LysR family regulator
MLFHRHARGLILTEQGELLYRTARDITANLKSRIRDHAFRIWEYPIHQHARKGST